MLIDDSSDDNFIHERAIKKTSSDFSIITKTSAKEALEYLAERTQPRVELIFLDINMPGMNGWDFLEAYNNLTSDQQGSPIIIMLTSSEYPEDLAKASTSGNITEYITKPLTKEIMAAIAEKYFL